MLFLLHYSLSINMHNYRIATYVVCISLYEGNKHSEVINIQSLNVQKFTKEIHVFKINLLA